MKRAVKRIHHLARPSRNAGVLTTLAVAAWVLAAQGIAAAHPESVSNLRLTLSKTGLKAVMTLPTRDLTRWFPPGRYPNYVSDVVKELQAEAGSLLEVQWDDVVARPSAANVHRGLTGFVIAELDYAVPAGAASLQVRSNCIGNLPSDHQQLTAIEDDRGPTPGGRVLVDEPLSAQQDVLSVDLPDVAPGAVAPVDSSSATPSATATAAAAAAVPPAPILAGAMQTPQRAGGLRPVLFTTTLVTAIVASAVIAGLFRLLRPGSRLRPGQAAAARASIDQAGAFSDRSNRHESV